MKITKIEGNHCPKCQHRLDGNTCVTREASPKPGDFSICAYCLTVCRYDDNLGLVIADEIPLFLKETIEQAHRIAAKVFKRGNRFMNKTYIGDSVYAQLDPFGRIILTTENGEGAPSNTIILEPEVYNNLTEWVASLTKE